MNITAIYHADGHIELSYPLRLRCLPAQIQVIVPDELIDMEIEEPDPVLKEIHAMLGTEYHYAPSGKTDQDILIESLEGIYCH
jgi:hypothetical protein